MAARRAIAAAIAFVVLAPDPVTAADEAVPPPAAVPPAATAPARDAADGARRSDDGPDAPSGSGIRLPWSDARPAPPEPDPHYALDIDAPDEIKPLIERQTLIGKWRRRREYDPEQFDALFARLPSEVETLVRALGYFGAEIAVGGDARRVTVKVDAGPRTTVGQVRLRLDGPVAGEPAIAARAQDAWRLPEGSFYTAADWETGKRLLVDGLRQRGYLRARIVDSRVRIDVEASAAALEVVVDSGPRIVFGELRVNGLSRYPRGVVEGLRTFREGQPFDWDTMLQFQTRLRDSGYFSGAYIVPDEQALERDPQAGAVPLTLELTERLQKRAIYGVGYSTDQGARGVLGFEHRNLFDRGWQLESGLVLEQLRQRAFATVRTPLEPSGHFWMGGARYEKQDVAGERTDKTTLFAGRGKRAERIESFTALQYQTEFRRVDVDGADPIEDRRRALTLGYSWNYRALDSRIDPRDGYTISAQVSGAAKGVLTDRSFARFYTRAMHFFPVNRESPRKGGIVIGLLELGVVAAHSREDIPSENLFRAGGAHSVRGYDYQTLGVVEGNAVVGGRLLGVASLEYQHPVSSDLWLAAFFDRGTAADRLAEFKPVNGYGVGLRWRTPIGPLNLDVAYGDAQKKWRVHFSVGYTF